jgi:hypothetical protein
MQGEDDRGIVKTAIVAHSYGSRPGRIENKWIRRNKKWVKIRKPAGMTKGVVDKLKERGQLTAAAVKLVPKLTSAIHRKTKERIPLIEGAKKFGRAITKLYADNGKDFHRTTPLGLAMINAYRTMLYSRIRVPFNGGWRKVKLAIGFTDEIDRDARNAAIRAGGANLIHSMDPCHLQMVALEAATVEDKAELKRQALLKRAIELSQPETAVDWGSLTDEQFEAQKRKLFK